MLLTFDTKTKPGAKPKVSQSTKSTELNTVSIRHVDTSNPDSDFFNIISKKKSRQGCITCKIRKKRCSEERPICYDCQRLNKNCVWATDEMTTEKIRELKKQVELVENESKLKKRKLTNIKKTAKSKPHDDNSDNTVKDLYHSVEEKITNTPISANLVNFPKSSTSVSSLSNAPSPNLLSLTQELFDLSADSMFEFTNTFENNIRNNSTKISEIFDHDEDEAHDAKQYEQQIQDDSNDQYSLHVHDFKKAKDDTSSPIIPMNLYNDFTLHVPKSPISNTFGLDAIGLRLYDYYQHKLSGIISIVPPESNHYTKVFLPMAVSNPGILYSIIAWSAFYIGGDLENEGNKYMEKTLTYLKQTPIRSENDSIQRLANLLILCGAEICKGDVKKWPVYLQWSSQLIKDNGGLKNFKKDRDRQWLISSFIYHDVLASSTSERGTYFPTEDYDEYLNDRLKVRELDPLQGIVKPLFNILGEISTLAVKSKQLLHNDEHSHFNDHDTYNSLMIIMKESSELENKINSSKPDPIFLELFSAEDLEIQLTLFELFQLTAKLHLRQSVLRLNPSSLESQFILYELLKCLDIVLKSYAECSLCFPLFIAGMNCITQKDRDSMLDRFNDLSTRYSFKNVTKVKMIMEQVWLIDPNGTKCVDWYEIVKKLGWDLNFA